MSFSSLNLELYSKQTTELDRFASRCLAPHRYLFNGRTVEVWRRRAVDSHPSFPEKNWRATAAAIALWFPGLILGTLARFLALNRSPSLKDDYQVAAGTTVQPLTAFERSHRNLEMMSKSIKDGMTSREVWSNTDFIEKVSQFFDAASDEIDLIYTLLETKYPNDPDAMATALIQQIERKDDENVYSFPYFYDSVTEMYHLARSCSYIESDYYQVPDLEDAEQAPYFDPSDQKFRWREIYNDFCNRFHELDQKSKVRDGRFANWSVPDTAFVNRYGFPDTRPTPSPSYWA